MANDFNDADLAHIAVAAAPVLDSDTVERIQFLLSPHLAAFAATEAAEVADVAELPTPERREVPGRAA